MGKRATKKGAARAKKPATHRTLKAAATAIKRKAARKVAAKPDETATAIGPATGAPLVTPKGLPPRPADTRWPAEIVVGKRHRTDYGDLAGLGQSISDRGGLLSRIAITPDNRLIAGERRLKAWPQSRFKSEPIPVHVMTPDSIIAGEWDENAQRKDFTPEEAVAIRNEIQRQLGTLARERQIAGKKAAPQAKGRSADQAGRATGFDRRTIDKAEAIVKAAEAEPEKYGTLRERMNKTGKVDGPFKRLRVMQGAEDIRNEPPPLPMHGPYRVLVADVPWPAEPDDPDPAARGRGYYPYATMAIDQLAAMGPEVRRICHPDGAYLWFWIPNFHLVRGLQLPILEAWGFTPVALRTWKKPHFGNGQVLRGQTEQVILCRRGKPPTVNLTNQSTWFDGKASGEHSEKPACFFTDVEALTPAPRYGYLFAGRALPANWDGHGDRVGKIAPTEQALPSAHRPSADRPSAAPGEGGVVSDAAAAAPTPAAPDDGLDIPTFPRRPLPDARPGAAE